MPDLEVGAKHGSVLVDRHPAGPAYHTRGEDAQSSGLAIHGTDQIDVAGIEAGCVGQDPQLIHAYSCFVLVDFGVKDTSARGHHLDVAGAETPSISERVLVAQRAFTYIAYDFHVLMGVHRKASLALDGGVGQRPKRS